jgi:hypothetical protein
MRPVRPERWSSLYEADFLALQTRPWTSCQLVGNLLSSFKSGNANGKQPESEEPQWLVLANKGGDLEVRHASSSAPFRNSLTHALHSIRFEAFPGWTLCSGATVWGTPINLW